MDRQIIYPGQIPLDTDLLNTNKNAMVALGKLAGAALGTAPVVNGLAVTPTAPASMNVQIAPGEIYALQNIDNTSYGSLAPDTVDQIVKQGILLAAINLPCPAPGTAGLSINYLIQAAFSETDTGSVALPYFNTSNPTQAWSGPSNSGTPQATARQNLCVVSVVAGTAAATGTQTTPAPTGSAIGLAVVTVAFGQISITSANITQYTGASLVPQSGLASNVAHAIYTKSVAGNTDVTLTAQEAAYPLLTLIGALTGNINLIVPAVSRQRVINNQTTGAGFNVNVKTQTGTGIVVPQGQTLSVYCDGVNVLNESSASLMPTPYADATGTPDAITAGYAVNNTTLYDGYHLALGITAPNATATPTFAPTLNGYAQTARIIVKYIANAPVPLAPGDLQGDAELRYDLPNARWILQNPAPDVRYALSGADSTAANKVVIAGSVTLSLASHSGKFLDIWSIAASAVITTPASLGGFNCIIGPCGSTGVTIKNGAATNGIYLPNGGTIAAGASYPLMVGINQSYELREFAGSMFLIPRGDTVAPGTIIDYAGPSAPAGYLLCPTVLTTVSTTTYSTLFAAIGYTWGGSGANFALPYFPADWVGVQASANVGTQTVGSVISHNHVQSANTMLYTGGAIINWGSGSYLTLGGTTQNTGGAANLAAGVRVLKCVKY